MNSTLFRFAFASVSSLTLTGALLAQSNPPPTPQTTPQPRTDQTTAQRGNSGATVTIVGCLMQGKDVPSLSSSTASANATDFFLTSATPSTGASTTGGTTGGTVGSATPATGTTPPATGGTAASGTRPTDAARAGGAGTAMTYRISGLDKDELTKHLNHQVEIQGTVSGMGNMGGSGRTGGTAGTTGTTGTAGTTGTTGTAGTTGATTGGTRSGQTSMSGDTAVINATSVRMISATCTAK